MNACLEGKGLARLWVYMVVIVVALASFFGGYIAAINLTRSEKTGSQTVPPQTTPTGENVTIIDSAGRYVTIRKPVSKVVILNTDVATAIMLLNASNVVVGVPDTVVQDREFYRNLADLPCVGKFSNPNYEAIIKLEPQLVIAYVQWPGSELEEKLEPLGIKVVRLDFYIPSKVVQEIKTLGFILGRESKADEICQWIGNLEKLVSDRLKGLKEEDKLRSYLEGGSAWTSAGPGSGQYDVAIKAGLKPIGEFTTAYPKVSAEWVIQQNPSLVMKLVYKSPFALNASYFESVKSDITTRLSVTNAVVNGKVILISNRFAFMPGSSPIAVLCIAKFAYPELFSDVDPKVYLRQYLSFLGLEYKGMWWYPLF